MQAHACQDFLDFIERLAAEVLGLEHLGLGLLHQLDAVGKFQHGASAGLEQRAQAGGEVVDVRRVGEDVVPKNQIRRAALMPENLSKAFEAHLDAKEYQQAYELVLYEGYGPHGVAILVEAATDNPVRTVASVRHLFTKHGGNLAANGSVSFQFRKMGVFRLKPDGLDQDDLELYLIDHGLEEMGEGESDKGEPQMEELAHRFGCRYVSRAKDGELRTDAKAGNLNYGLVHSHGAYVLTLDADQVPNSQILERMAPYLAIKNTAFIQSKQTFLVPYGDPFYCEDLVFYNTLQPAFDANDMVLSCGSGVLYRREALDSIGGFVTWNLVEDLTTSYELHCKGWKSQYYPYPMAVGLAPDTVWGVYRQRGQWALDTMRLFWWRNPLTRTTLEWRKRINYFIIGFSYLTAGFVAPLFYVIPVWTYLTGKAILTGNELDFALWRTLYFLTMTLAMRWLFRHHEPGKQFQMLVGLFPVYASSAIRALFYRHTKPGYSVNNVKRKRRQMPPIVALIPQLMLLLANALGPFYALMANSAPPRIIAANACVSALAIWSLSHVCLAALDRHTWQVEKDPVIFYAAAES
mgnify:CR=1 FL=1